MATRNYRCDLLYNLWCATEPEDDTTEGAETQLVPQQSTSDTIQNKEEDRLSKLKQMLEQGIITEEEYTKKK